MMHKLNGSADVLPEGSCIGNYEIVGVLGRGGGAVTYACCDTLLGREVALKEHFPLGLCRRNTKGYVVAAEGAEELFEKSVDIFLQEARTIAGLRHEGIVAIHDVLAARGTAYAVLELEEGEPLDAWLQSHAAQPQSVEEMLKKLLDVLAYLHERHVFHRDIKPGNILVREGDRPVLLDFGAARVGEGSGPNTIVGTPLYAAPEQFQPDGKPGPWSDLYALGNSFLQSLGAETVAALPRRLRRSLYTATRTDPTRRFRSAAAWLQALQPARRRGLRFLLAATLPPVTVVLFAMYAAGRYTAPSPAPSEDERPLLPFDPNAPITDLNGYTLNLNPEGKSFAESPTPLFAWQELTKAELMQQLQHSFSAPDNVPLTRDIFIKNIRFQDNTWSSMGYKGRYSYVREENSDVALLITESESRMQRTPYLLRFTGPTKGQLAFPLSDVVWSCIPFTLTANHPTPRHAPLPPEAPRSLSGHYLALDLSEMRSYEVSDREDNPLSGQGAQTDRKPPQIGGSCSLIRFTDETHWACGSRCGRYTYDCPRREEARLLLYEEEDDLPVMQLRLLFDSRRTGRMIQHIAGATSAAADIRFELQRLGQPPRDSRYLLFLPETEYAAPNTTDPTPRP